MPTFCYAQLITAELSIGRRAEYLLGRERVPGAAMSTAPKWEKLFTDDGDEPVYIALIH